MENGTQLTFEKCMPETYQKQTVGASDSHARTSRLQESNSDFKEIVQACFSELCTLSDSSKTKINPLTFSLRTLKICLVLMEDGISPDCSLKWIGGGYDAEWQVLNSRDFGVPQNRERCFIIGHLRGRSSSEVFPVERTSGENRISIIAHRDGFHRNLQTFSTEGICETLDTGQGGGRGTYVPINILNKDYRHNYEAIHDADGICGTLMARDYKDPKRICMPVLTPDRAEKRQNGRRFKDDGEPMFTLTGQDRHGVAIEPIGIIDPQGRKTKMVVPRDLSPTLRSQSYGNEPSLCVKVAEATKQGYSECRVGVDNVNLTVPGSKTRRGRVGHEVANTPGTSCNQGIFVQASENLIVYAVWYEKYQCYIAIRKLTPKECFRLQGWTDDYFEKAAFVNSDSQLYKEAGNGVTVSVIEAMAKEMRME
nr:MAG TPA: Cytosine specific methyltransferase [Caudoviricetes sp.]